MYGDKIRNHYPTKHTGSSKFKFILLDLRTPKLLEKHSIINIFDYTTSNK